MANLIVENWQKHGFCDMLDAIRANKYKNENHFSDLIEQNMETVCKNIFDSSLIKFQREYNLPSYANKKLRADFFIETSDGNILLECKTPNGQPQTAIAQLMKYIVVCEEGSVSIDRYVAFTTSFNRYDHQIIKRFNLPIELYFITNEKVYTIYNGN